MLGAPQAQDDYDDYDDYTKAEAWADGDISECRNVTRLTQKKVTNNNKRN